MAEYIERRKVIDITAETGALETQRRVKELPVADVAPVVHGRWIKLKNTNWPAYEHDSCSICGWWNTRNAMCYEGRSRRRGHSLNFCPNCGAKMDKEE